jgi:tetratricopeptide (TPR) repeat protein
MDHYRNNLHYWIKRRGYKLYEVADLTGIPQRTLNDYCKGRTAIPKDRLETLVSFLECSIAVLVNDEAPSPPPVSIEEVDNTAEEQAMDKSRRQLLQQIIGVGGLALFASPETLLDDMMGLATCWELYHEGKSAQVASLPPVYRHHFSVLAHQSSPIQKQASALASEVYQLSCELATDSGQFTAAQQACQLALLYAQYSEEPNIQAAAHMRQANIYFHQQQPEQALSAYQQTLPVLSNTSPLLKGRIYAGLAEVQAMRQEKQEALTYTGLAHEHYPEHPELDSAYRYTHATQYSLYVFGEGQTRLFLQQPKAAEEAFTYVEKHIITPQTDPLTRVDLLYYQTLASVMMEDLPTSCDRIIDAVHLARDIKSQLYYNKIYGTYQDMKKKWRYERQIIDLEGLFQH